MDGLFDVICLRTFDELNKIFPDKKLDKRKLSRDEKAYSDLAVDLLVKLIFFQSLAPKEFTSVYLLLRKHPNVVGRWSSDYCPSNSYLDLEVIWKTMMSDYDGDLSELFLEVFKDKDDPWTILILLLEELKGSISSPEFQIRVLYEEEELPHVCFFRDQLGKLTGIAKSLPPEGLNELLLKELFFLCLDSVGASTKGINRNKSFSEMIEDYDLWPDSLLF